MLEIDPDRIFEEKTIAEIEAVQKKIQDEVERKKRELRTMVGERYRDLIEAADTIKSMQVTAAGVIERVKNMEDLCGTLQQHQLIGFQLDVTRPSHTIIDRSDITGIGIAVQVKVLVVIPEQIWVAVEREDFLLGTQLFLLARHIKTGLHLESSTLLEGMMSVVVRQWAAISHFQEKLVAGARKSLGLADITPQVAAKCLCVLALLENYSGEELLNQFLDVRKKTFHSILLQDNDKISVKQRVAASLHFLLRSLALLHSCFVEARAGLPEGIVWQQLHALNQEHSQSSEAHGLNAIGALDLLDLCCIESTTLRFLTPVIKDFRPSSRAGKETLQLTLIKELSAHWLESIHSFLKDALASLLSLVTSVKALQSIRDTSIKEQQGTTGTLGWESALQKLQLSCGLDLWAAYYQPIVSTRVCDLVEQQWVSALATLRQKLADDLRAVLRDKTHQPEHDLRWLVWRERSSDLPQHSAQGGFLPQSHGLLLKCRGYSPRIEALCQSLDLPLSALLQELTAYACEADVDRNDLQQHLQLCSTKHLKELCCYIEEDCLAGAAGRNEASVALVARLLGALCDLSPALQSCFIPLMALTTSKTVGVSTAWTDMVNTLQSCSKQAWTVWQELVSSNLSVALQDRLLPQSGNLSALLLHSTPQWEEHFMEEQGEEGDHVSSVIRVPIQPTLALQQVLAEACQILGAAQPHTIPSEVRIAIVERLVGDILKRYSSAVTPDLAQAQALQFLLDTRFLTSLLIPRSHRVLTSQAQEVCQRLEEKIDPFDLDVYSPFLQNNVRLSVRHVQCLLGVLISCWPEKLASMWASSSSIEKNTAVGTGVGGGGGKEQPSMLAVCPAVPWFPLLPVVLPASSGTTASASASAQPQVPKEKSQTRRSAGTRSPKRRPEPMENIKSGAAAFFGAMSSDWFS